MAEPGQGTRPSDVDSGSGRILVDDGATQRPFMRGIMIHSLMARGIPFDQAYATADQIRQTLRRGTVVTTKELSETLLSILGPAAEEPPIAPDISVTAGGKAAPFSKGVLSQSLLAAGIDQNDAFEVAREIERDLLIRGVDEIDRTELRERAYQALARRMGAETAERYLIWRRYQEPDRPVILLLGGTAGVGKTSLALEVAHRLGIGRVLSTDSIRQVMRVMLSQELVPAIYGSSYDAHKLAPSATGGAQTVVEGFRSQAASVSVGIRAMMDRAVAENTSLVLDGVSIVPGLLDLDAYEEIADVIFVVVSALDPEAFSSRFERRARGQRKREPHRYLENLSGILQIQDHLLELADQYGIPIVDNASFDRTVRLIIRHVAETLRKRGGFDAGELR